MTDLRALARGKPCHLRLPGTCTHNPEQTVLCHLRRGGIAGIGQKPSDLAALPACEACHSALDGRLKTTHSRAQIDADALRGLCQWLAYLEKNGYIGTGQPS
jgi:hypothetical protein